VLFRLSRFFLVAGSQAGKQKNRDEDLISLHSASENLTLLR
jgi:hypothetical protein